MGNLSTWLLGMAAPLVLKVLAALGMGTLAFTGVAVALQGLIDMATSNWSSIGSDVLALASLAGFPEALGLIAGAYVSRVGMWSAASATKWVTK